MKKTVTIISVILATLIGAGFASGKEIYSFFFIYGKCGIIGIIISSAIITLVTYKVLSMCNKNNIKTYQEFCQKLVAGKYKTNKINLLKNIINIFILITFYIMISGFSSFLNQVFSINKICGSIVICTMCYFIFQKNLKGISQISKYAIPVVIFFIIIISLKNLDISYNYQRIFINHSTTFTFYIIKSTIKSILYSCYNCIILIPVLIAFSRQVPNKKQRVTISCITFILVMMLSLAIFNILLQGTFENYNLEMPIIEIVKQHGVFYQNIYMIIIGISILTTAISTGFGFLNNLNNNSNSAMKNNGLIVCVTAILISQVSFSFLVRLLYPILGLLGAIEVFAVLKFKNE